MLNRVYKQVLARILLDRVRQKLLTHQCHEKSGCGLSFGTVRITDLDFADDAVIFAETTKVLEGALNSLSEEAEPLGLRVSWIKTKV